MELFVRVMQGGGSPQLYYHDCSEQRPRSHHKGAIPVGFELTTSSILADMKSHDSAKIVQDGWRRRNSLVSSGQMLLVRENCCFVNFSAPNLTLALKICSCIPLKTGVLIIAVFEVF